MHLNDQMQHFAFNVTNAGVVRYVSHQELKDSACERHKFFIGGLKSHSQKIKCLTQYSL